MFFSCFTFVDYIQLLLISRLKSSSELMLYFCDTCRLKINLILSYLILTAKLISAFVFASRIVQFLFFLNPKFQAASHRLCLYRPVCVRPCQNPRGTVFSRRGSYVISHSAALNFSPMLNYTVVVDKKQVAIL